jgi:hypothetical protein
MCFIFCLVGMGRSGEYASLALQTDSVGCQAVSTRTITRIRV